MAGHSPCRIGLLWVYMAGLGNRGDSQMNSFAYRLDDQNWPPTMFEVLGDDPETGMVILSPVNNPAKVIFLKPSEIWVIL